MRLACLGIVDQVGHLQRVFREVEELAGGLAVVAVVDEFVGGIAEGFVG